MRIKRMILTALLVVAIALVWSLQAGAYELFTADQEPDRCSQCHDAWNGSGAAEHDFHTGAGIECSACHVGSDPVAVSACAVCHPAPGMLELHGPLEAPNGQYCGLCHEGVATDGRSWTELKNIFE